MLKTLKSDLRHEMGERLAKLSRREIAEQSEKVLRMITASEWYRETRRISIYVSTDGEVQTDTIIRHALNNGKDVFIPQFPRGTNIMEMVKLPNEAEFDALPAPFWGIRQPKVEWKWEKYERSGPLDTILVPGVAFCNKRHRLGHGKGYYDRWLANHRKMFGVYPKMIGLALEEQIIAEVPVSSTDVVLDTVLSAHSGLR